MCNATRHYIDCKVEHCDCSFVFTAMNDIYMSAQGHPWVFNEWWVNPQTTEQAAAGPKQHYTKVQQNSCPYIIQQHKSKLKVKTKQYIQRPEVPDLQLGQVQKIWSQPSPF